jgi:hypothetical protein
MYKYYGILGGLFFIAPHIFGAFDVIICGPFFTAILMVFSYIIGLGLFFDALCFRLTKSSLIYDPKKPIKWIYLISGIAVLAFISEFFGAYILELWKWGADLQGSFVALKEFLPLLSFNNIIIIMAVGTLYYLFMFLALFACFKIIYHFIKRSTSLNILGILLSAVFLSLLVLIIIKSCLFSQYKEVILISILLGLWLFCEYVGYRRTKRGLLKIILGSDFRPFIGLAASTFIIGLMVESITLFIPAWAYQNLPWHNIQLFNAPLSFFIIWWLPISIVFLSFYQSFIEPSEEDKLF